MKKTTSKPGFEFIFTLSLMAMLGLPHLVMAQNQKNIDITIANGDTTINGKDIKQLTLQERKDVLAEISSAPQPPPLKGNGNTNRRVVIKRSFNGDNYQDVTIKPEVPNNR